MKKLFIILLLSTLMIQSVAYATILTSDTATAEAFANNYQETVSDKITKMSPIEELFNTREMQATGSVLKQVGYDLFSAPSSTSSTTTGKFDNNYRLSIGEKVNVYLYGEAVDVIAMSGVSLLNPTNKTEVDSKGNIFIPGIGLVTAENRTVSEVEQSITKLASGKYKNLKVKLTVASGQEFSVFVYGQVNRPGKVLIGNNSSVLDALNAAGGVKKTGTLRNISYFNGKTQTIDLYKIFFTGNDSNLIVRPNDKIFVDKIGNVVALKNGVTLPGIYEIKPNENLETIVKFAGGLLPTTQSTEVTMTRFDGKLKQRSAMNVSWENANKTKLESGDSIEFRKMFNDTENVITLQGNVKHPTTFAYKDGMRLSDILKNEDELLEETFINQAVIRRISGKDNKIETIPVFLKEFFAGMNDPVLQPKDIINIYKNTNSQFVDVYGCIDTPKHLTYNEGMTLDDVMTDVKFLESAIQNLSNDNSQTIEKPVSLSGSVEETTTQLVAETANSNKLLPTEEIAVEITNDAGDTNLFYLYDIMINSDKIKTIQLQPKDKIFFRTLRDNEVLKTVKVSGFVATPGVFKFVEGKHLVDMIQMAGGITSDADLRGLVYRRNNIKSKQTELAMKNNERDIKLLEGRLAGGFKQTEQDQNSKMEMIDMLKEETKDLSRKYTGQISLNIKDNDLTKIKEIDNLLVQDGDDIYVPRMSNHVSILGEVYNEQSFVYKPNAKVKYYINEVGGYTPNANKFRLYKVSVNGRAEKVRMGSLVQVGDTIVVPRKIAGNDWITPICDTLRGLASLVVMAFAVNRW